MMTRKKRPIAEDLESEAERWREAQMEKPSWNTKECTLEPLSSMKVNPTEVVITVDLPLTEESDIKVRAVDKSTIEIVAKLTRKIKLEELGIVQHEGEFHRFHCHSHIPVPVDMNRMEFKFRKGMLQIRLPRKYVPTH